MQLKRVNNMKKIILGLLLILIYSGCGSNDIVTKQVGPKLVKNKSLEGFSLNDQFDRPYILSKDTKTIIFAFSKEIGHLCNEFFVTQDDLYLHNNKTVFVANISSAPSIIRAMYIIPGLQDFDHRVLVIDNEDTASLYEAGLDTDKIVIVSLDNTIITDIKTVNTINELRAIIEK